jgi:hypothetical protein
MCQKATFAVQQIFLFDHLVGECEQPDRHVEPKRPRGPEVDDQLELGRPHDRQVGGLLAVSVSNAAASVNVRCANTNGR